MRIGSSWDITPRNVDSNFYVAEVRRHWYENPLWDYRGSIKKCIDNDIYLIFQQCLGYNKTIPHPEYYPTENEWRERTEKNIQIIKSYGANKNNCMMSLINEPTKYFRVENGHNGVNDLIRFTNIMHDQIAGRFDLGSGNMEFYDAAVLGDWYRYLCRDGEFEWLLIHIQNSCDTDENTKKYTDYARGLADMYGKKLSCSEANSTEWDVSTGDYQKLLMQLGHAERIGCQDFCIVVMDLDTQAAKQEVGNLSNLYKICFNIDGIKRTDNYNDIIRIADEKHPVPNIPIIEEEDDMKLDSLYYQNRPEHLYKRDPEKRGIKFLRACFGLSDGNIFDNALDAKVREYQSINGMLVDGKVGPETFGGLILEADYQKYYNWVQHDWATYSK